MKAKGWLYLACVVGLISCSSAKKGLNHEYTVMSYNVENLFDTVDDPRIPDEEFLPSSEKKWDNEKYQKKLTDIAKVISKAATCCSIIASLFAVS